MRECILGNFRRRLLGALKTDNDLQRPSVLESLIRRHVSIMHLAEQHISMDITQGIREVLLSEAFSGPVSSLHLFEKPTDQHTGSATESVCNWYIENIIKDVSDAGILFIPIRRCFRSTRPVGGYFAESVTDLRELQAFILVVKKLDKRISDHHEDDEFLELINSIDRIRHANIVELIGYCLEHGQRLLIYEYCSKGSNLRDDDGAKRVFFGGERFMEGISGEAYVIMQFLQTIL